MALTYRPHPLFKMLKMGKSEALIKANKINLQRHRHAWVSVQKAVSTGTPYLCDFLLQDRGLFLLQSQEFFHIWTRIMFYMSIGPFTQRSQRTLYLPHMSQPLPLWGRYYPYYLQMGKFRHRGYIICPKSHSESPNKTVSRCCDSCLHNPTTNTSLNFQRALNKYQRA